MRLRPYQQDAVAAILDEWDRHQDTLLVVPTGGGKTHIFLAALSRALGGRRALITAHRSELLDQAEERMREHQLPRPGLVQGSRDNPHARVVLATTQTLARPGRLESILERDPPAYYIRDEAHRILSDTDRQILAVLRYTNPSMRVLGVTATPKRTDGQALGRLFDSVAYQISIRELVDLGYLVRPVEIEEHLPFDLSGIPLAGGDLSATLVGEVLNDLVTHETVFNTWLKHGRERPTLGFTPTVALAADLAAYFRRNGVFSAHLSGATTKSEEARWDEAGILSAFRQGKIQVLFNAYKLVEGVDVPMCSCILWVRPTLSRLVYQQGVGRGLRVYPGKKDCIVINFSPGCEDLLVGVDDILGGYYKPLLGMKRPWLPEYGIPSEQERAEMKRFPFLGASPRRLLRMMDERENRLKYWEQYIRGEC